MHKFYVSVIFIFLLITGAYTADKLTWSLEVFPVIIGGAILFFTYKRFQLTNLVYTLITIHCLILIYGGMYTYANTPFGNVIRDSLGLNRNPYDRIGHFAQGFIPAILIRELYLRVGKFQKGKLLNASIVLTCMGVSAGYEIIEWGAALLLNQGADEFLGTQGDRWDIQWDMFLAMIGSIVSISVLSAIHDKQLTGIPYRINPSKVS